MKDIGEGTIRRIDWTELTPIVLLLRIFNTSLGIRVLAIALAGWWFTKLLNFFAGFVIQNSSGPLHGQLPRVNVPLDVIHSAYLETLVSVQQNPMNWAWLAAIALTWLVCGGLIGRLVAVRLTIDESETNRNLCRFLKKRCISFVSPIILLILGIFCCFLPVKIAGLLLAVPILKYAVAVCFPIPLLFAFLTVLLSVGLVSGWVLLLAAVCVDGSDGFDAISRMFSYLFQRPLHYILYWICCAILGWLGYALVQFLVYAAVQLCWNVLPDSSLVESWLTLAESIPCAYIFAWFWTSGIAVYLLLRRSVDAAPFDEVYRLEPPKVRTLPVIKKDELGAPEITK